MNAPHWTILRYRFPTPGGAQQVRAYCPVCGWRGPLSVDPAKAEADGRDHEETSWPGGAA